MKRRIVILTLVVTLIVSLFCGCGEKTSESLFAETLPTQPQQVVMPDGAFENLRRQVEYALLCAYFEQAEYYRSVKNGYIGQWENAFVGDIDADGNPEMIYGYNAMVFDADNQVACYKWEQSGNEFYQTNKGIVYAAASIGDGLEGEYLGRDPDKWYEFYTMWYERWTGENWETDIQESCDAAYPLLDEYPDDYYENRQFLSKDMDITVEGVALSEDAYEAYKKEIGLEKIHTTAADFTQIRVEGEYLEDIVQRLRDVLPSDCSGYGGAYSGDFDQDGMEETLFAATNYPLAAWYTSLRDHSLQFFDDSNWQWINTSYDLTAYRNVYLLADSQGETAVLTAFCVPDGAQLENITYSNGVLHMGGVSAPLNATAESLDACYPWLQTVLQQNGYECLAVKLADISDADGQDLLCYARKEGTLYIIIFIFRNGMPYPAYVVDTDRSAVYLTQYDGKTCLLDYYQNMGTSFDGTHYSEYGYSLMRFDAHGQYITLDSQYLFYDEHEDNASQAAAFFDKLNQYIVQIIVVYDPFSLQGQKWPTEVDVGDDDLKQEQPPADEKLGFVQLNDISSWLNLRVGPGTQYDRVLMDPDDPDSFVRQAHGSPVTILEEITTGDAENPVWVKVRIHYGSAELVGYSAKGYIRTAE